ncbi:ABC transporter ATP-binding protein [Desulfitobacterium chlororespirans]|uniref:Peptide/nickel transport system ATP-binding protein n=1 Tax=Desulfitobacterium chlororespirans DSM 11544 TaxID=1121395 RepID=A0A1M7S4T4_9FIRM|nr:ATP-binding cassette domain-containing protein [Desulfitobacterium chlororespirans]SHN53451.1 peptide/nickel transport system ATP-binding protein [Desulfitobacterium chlororespirans DSM 11544]
MQLEAKDIYFRYTSKTAPILSQVDFTLKEGEKLALVGPSGCGKSTLAKILAGYIKPSGGTVLLDGRSLPDQGYSPVQMIYQHPELAVNPRWKMSKIIHECWTPNKELLKDMGIEKEWMSRWPTELSGGELQRFCVLRALGPETRFLICDEITTMLDVITQAQLWQIILDIAEKNRLGLIVVTHNNYLADKVCDRIVKLTDINHV